MKTIIIIINTFLISCFISGILILINIKKNASVTDNDDSGKDEGSYDGGGDGNDDDEEKSGGDDDDADDDEEKSGGDDDDADDDDDTTYTECKNNTKNYCISECEAGRNDTIANKYICDNNNLKSPNLFTIGGDTPDSCKENCNNNTNCLGFSAKKSDDGKKYECVMAIDYKDASIYGKNYYNKSNGNKFHRFVTNKNMCQDAEDSDEDQGGGEDEGGSSEDKDEGGGEDEGGSSEDKDEGGGEVSSKCNKNNYYCVSESNAKLFLKHADSLTIDDNTKKYWYENYRCSKDSEDSNNNNHLYPAKNRKECENICKNFTVKNKGKSKKCDSYSIKNGDESEVLKPCILSFGGPKKFVNTNTTEKDDCFNSYDLN